MTLPVGTVGTTRDKISLLIVMLKAFDVTAMPLASVAVMVIPLMVLGVVAALGVPEITPVEALIVKPLTAVVELKVFEL